MFSDEPTVDLDKDDEIIASLAERWPRCFMLAEDRRLPLKVGTSMTSKRHWAARCHRTASAVPWALIAALQTTSAV
jgi:sRNA-binding protein